MQVAGRMSYGGELLAAAAGPAVNLLLAAALGLLGRWWEPLYLLAGAQAVLGCFNLLPILPLDGGRMLWLALCWGTDPFLADRVAQAVSLAAAGLLAAGCSTENDTEATGYGTLSVSCTADTSIDTASAEASGTPEAPAAGAFSLTVTGETGTQKWDTLTEFEQSETVFRMGSYTVAIAHGDPDAEGAGKPYYYAEQKIEVLPRRTVNADLTATVANSQVVIRATEQFLAYFHDARFTVTTASGNEFAFTPGSDPADEPVFVKGGTRLTVTGTARRQSPTGTGEGPEVTFSAQTLDATTPRTCHIITYDAKNAGSATLTITLGDSYTDTRTLDCEVNEGAIDDTEKK